MKERLVRRIKSYPVVTVKNALESIGYVLKKPKHPPTNIEVMVGGLPRCALKDLLKVLEDTI